MRPARPGFIRDCIKDALCFVGIVVISVTPLFAQDLPPEPKQFALIEVPQGEDGYIMGVFWSLDACRDAVKDAGLEVQEAGAWGTRHECMSLQEGAGA